MAGLIGIGAGMFLGSILILNGVHPSISTATTATMVVLTCNSIAVIYVMSGMVPWEYATYFFLACMCGAYIGKTRVDAYVNRTGMVSMLIGTLATIIAFATVGCVSILLMVWLSRTGVFLVSISFASSTTMTMIAKHEHLSTRKECSRIERGKVVA